jgi:predicted RNA-binding Zn-ribbon protein involved in translation (DUF1610 family)
MLPLRDFLAAKKRYERYSAWALLPLLGGVLLGGLLFAAMGVWYTPAPGEPVPPGPMLVGGCLLLAAFIGGIYGSAQLAPRPAQFPEMSCPHCRELYRDPSGIVAATRKCPKCLKYVLKEDAEPPPVLGQLLTLEQVRRVNRNRWRGAILLVGSWPIAMLALVCALVYYSALPAHVTAGKHFNDGDRGRWQFAALMLSGPIAAALLYGWRALLRCPNCRTSIKSLATVIASRNCPTCGRTIVKDAVPHTEYRPLPKLAHVSEAERKYSWRIGIRLFGGIGIAYGISLAGTAMKNALPPEFLGLPTHWISPAIVGVGAATLVVAWWAMLGQYRRFPELMCSSCGHTIMESSLVARCTGNCPHCGERVIKDA